MSTARLFLASSVRTVLPALLALAVVGCSGLDPATAEAGGLTPGPVGVDAAPATPSPDAGVALSGPDAASAAPSELPPPIQGTVPAQGGSPGAADPTQAGGPSGRLRYFGGALMQNVKLYQLLWGAPGPGRTFIPEVANGRAAEVYRAYVEGPWLDWIDAEYSTALYRIGRGQFAGRIELELLRPESRGDAVHDADVQAEIGAQVAAGKLPADPDALFVISFPAEVDVLQSLSAYGRGVGALPGDCGAGEKDAGLCYPPCREGYDGVGPVCWQICPEGYHDDGAFCRRPGSIISADNDACPWYDVCGLTLARGCSTCPAGYANDGCTCRVDPEIFAKSSYGRGVGRIPGCADGMENDAGLCYPRCVDGFDGVGPVCWGHNRFCGGHAGFCGYHSRFLHGVTDVRYAVIADMGPAAACYGSCWTGQPFSDHTKTFSHELVEAITDPVVGTGWTDLAEGEIGDICNAVTTEIPDPTGSYVVQSEWSNQTGTCR